MPIYRLSPVEAQKDHYEWLGSSHHEPILIRAQTEEGARDLAQLVCSESVPRDTTPNTCFGPWGQSALVSCSV